MPFRYFQSGDPRNPYYVFRLQLGLIQIKTFLFPDQNCTQTISINMKHVYERDRTIEMMLYGFGSDGLREKVSCVQHVGGITELDFMQCWEMLDKPLFKDKFSMGFYNAFCGYYRRKFKVGCDYDVGGPIVGMQQGNRTVLFGILAPVRTEWCGMQFRPDMFVDVAYFKKFLMASTTIAEKPDLDGEGPDYRRFIHFSEINETVESSEMFSTK